jgi:hypothetical protein
MDIQLTDVPAESGISAGLLELQWLAWDFLSKGSEADLSLDGRNGSPE